MVDGWVNRDVDSFILPYLVCAAVWCWVGILLRILDCACLRRRHA